MKLRFAIFTVLMLAPAMGAGAQPVGDYDFTKGINPYLSSSNPAFLGAWKDGKISKVEVTGRKGNGDLVSLEKSNDDLEAQAMTESFVRVSEKIAFYGTLDYTYFTGNNMGGQILMDPSYNPFNFLEATDTTRGVKNRETYRVAGAMGYSFNDRWTAGIKLDYEGGIQAKRRDPRFKNTWLDLNLAAGVRFAASEHNSFGMDLLYRRTIEQVLGTTYGKKDNYYQFLTDKGGFYGVIETLNGNTPTLAQSENRPILNTFYGAALQYSYTGRNKFFNEVSFLLRDGHYGSTGNSSPTFFEFGGMEFGYKGTALLPSGSNLSKISLDAGMKMLNNAENSYNYVTTTGGSITTVEYTGQKSIFNATDIDADLSYVFYQGMGSGRPTAEYGADVLFYMRTQKTNLYPYWREHNHMNIDATLWARRNFKAGKNGLLTPGVYGRFFMGSGVASKDGAATTAKSKSLKSFDFWLNRQFEFDTATRAGGELSLTYTRIFAKLTTYITISDSFMTMFSAPQYLPGGNRNIATVTVGCDF